MTRVWVTRTQPSAEPFATELRKAGLSVTTRPLIRVVPTKSKSPVLAPDAAIFLSQNAARLADLDQLQPKRYIAIGNATRLELLRKGVMCCDMPPIASSEGLLDWLNLRRVTPLSVLIVTGQGGRKLLRDGMLSHGASVEEWEVYRRECVKPRFEKVGLFDAVEISSVAALESLYWLFAQEHRCTSDGMVLVVASRRIACEARKLGFQDVQVTKDASARGFIAQLRQIPHVTRFGRDAFVS